MRNNRPIRTRPWKRPPWRRKARSGFWWVPPVSDGSDDASFSCWADSDFALGMEGNAAGLPDQLRIPIVWNVQGGFPPGVMGAFDPKFRAHPLNDKFFVSRIVGDVAFQGQHITEGVNDCVPTGPIYVHCSLQDTGTIGDGVVVFDPELNDGALGRRRIHERRFFVSQEFVGCHQCDGENHDGATTDGSTVTAFQRFGVPTAKNVHFDVRPRALVRPEMTLTLVVTANSPCKDRDTVFVLPKLKVWIEKS